MAILSRLYDFQPETVIKSQEVDDELNQILSEINGNIDTVNIKDLAITAAKINSGAVGTTHLANGAVTNAKLGTDAVATANIQDLAISNAKLALLAVQTGNIVDDAVTADKIASLAVTSVKIANSAITNSKLATGAVTDVKIQDNSITGAKLIDGSIDEDELADNAVSSVKIQNNAVIGTKLPSSVITTDKINNGAVTNDKIGSNAVTNVKIQDSSIESSKLQNGAVITDKITNLAVTTVKIADLNVTNAKIGASAVDSSKIATGAVDYNKFNSNVAGNGLEYDVLNRHNGIYINNDSEFLTFGGGGVLTLANGVSSSVGITKDKMRPVDIEPATLILVSDIGTNLHTTNVRQGLAGFNVTLKDSDNAQYTSGSQFANGDWNIGDGIIIDAWNEGDYLVKYHSWIQSEHYKGETLVLTIAVNNADYLQSYNTITMDYTDASMHTVFPWGACPISVTGVIHNLTAGDVVNIKTKLLSDDNHGYFIRLSAVGNSGNGDTPPFGAMMSFHRITFSQP
jgi:hypothetical protein